MMSAPHSTMASYLRADAIRDMGGTRRSVHLAATDQRDSKRELEEAAATYEGWAIEVLDQEKDAEVAATAHIHFR